MAWRDFFPRWSTAEVSRGRHWDLFEMQGRYGLWVVGDGASYESTKSVMEYNRLILRQAQDAEEGGACAAAAAGGGGGVAGVSGRGRQGSSFFTG